MNTRLLHKLIRNPKMHNLFIEANNNEGDNNGNSSKDGDTNSPYQDSCTHTILIRYM